MCVALIGFQAIAQYELSLKSAVLWTMSQLNAFIWYVARLSPVWSAANMWCVITHYSVREKHPGFHLFLVSWFSFELIFFLEHRLFVSLYGFSPLATYIIPFNILCSPQRFVDQGCRVLRVCDRPVPYPYFILALILWN